MWNVFLSKNELRRPNQSACLCWEQSWRFFFPIPLYLLLIKGVYAREKKQPLFLLQNNNRNHLDWKTSQLYRRWLNWHRISLYPSPICDSCEVRYLHIVQKLNKDNIQRKYCLFSLLLSCKGYSSFHCHTTKLQRSFLGEETATSKIFSFYFVANGTKNCISLCNPVAEWKNRLTANFESGFC